MQWRLRFWRRKAKLTGSNVDTQRFICGSRQAKQSRSGFVLSFDENVNSKSLVIFGQATNGLLIQVGRLTACCLPAQRYVK